MRLIKMYYEGCDCYLLTNTGRILKSNMLYFMERALFKNTTIDISIDQSTSATGLSIFRNKEWLLSIQIDLSSYDSNTSVILLEDFLNEMTEGSTVKRFIPESIYQAKGVSRNTYNKLSYLKEVLKSLSIYADAFNNCLFDPIPANSWRSGFITVGKQGKGRVEKKQNVLEEAIRRVSAFKEFAKYCGKDYDAIESYGIYQGWLAKNFTNETRKINKSLKSTDKCWYKVKYIKDDTSNDDCVDLVKKTLGIDNVERFETDLTLEETVKRIAANYSGRGWFWCPSGEQVWLALKYKTILQNGYKFLVYCSYLQ